MTSGTAPMKAPPRNLMIALGFRPLGGGTTKQESRRLYILLLVVEEEEGMEVGEL